MQNHISLNELANVDITTVDKDKLVDVTGITFDDTIPQEQRLARVIERVKNPYCFRVGNMGVKVEFAENAPSLDDLLIDFLKRQKSGL